MSIIKKEEIEKLAELARLKLTSEESDQFQKEIDSILSYVKQVQEVSSDNQKDLPAGIFSSFDNTMREDKDPHQSGEFSQDILKGSPAKEGDYFKVKKIL